MIDVVLVFSRKDYWTAGQIGGALKRRGLEAAHLDFVTGNSLDLEGIHRNARAVVLLWSQDAASAAGLRARIAEAAAALADKAVLVVRLDATELPLGLRDLDATATDWGPRPRKADYDALAAAIAERCWGDAVGANPEFENGAPLPPQAARAENVRHFGHSVSNGVNRIFTVARPDSGKTPFQSHLLRYLMTSGEHVVETAPGLRYRVTPVKGNLPSQLIEMYSLSGEDFNSLAQSSVSGRTPALLPSVDVFLNASEAKISFIFVCQGQDPSGDDLLFSEFLDYQEKQVARDFKRHTSAVLVIADPEAAQRHLSRKLGQHAAADKPLDVEAFVQHFLPASTTRLAGWKNRATIATFSVGSVIEEKGAEGRPVQVIAKPSYEDARAIYNWLYERFSGQRIGAEQVFMHRASSWLAHLGGSDAPEAAGNRGVLSLTVPTFLICALLAGLLGAGWFLFEPIRYFVFLKPPQELIGLMLDMVSRDTLLLGLGALAAVSLYVVVKSMAALFGRRRGRTGRPAASLVPEADPVPKHRDAVQIAIPQAKALLTTPRNDAATADARHVFVSYSRKDAAAVQKLAHALDAKGIAVWIDTRAPAEAARFAGPIVRALRSARSVALMCSANAFNSDHVVRELYLGGQEKKHFVAVRLDDAAFPEDFDYFLSGFPRVEASERSPVEVATDLAPHLSA